MNQGHKRTWGVQVFIHPGAILTRLLMCRAVKVLSGLGGGPKM